MVLLVANSRPNEGIAIQYTMWSTMMFFLEQAERLTR